jgi:hypothetical protein
MESIGTKSQEGDILTMLLPGPAHAAFVRAMGRARQRKEVESSLELYMWPRAKRQANHQDRARDNGRQLVARRISTLRMKEA